jgi:hypothetical protein
VVGDLEEAWAEAEAALPDEWMMDELTRLHGAGFKADAWIAKAIFRDHNAGPLLIAVGPTPAGALHALAAKFREAALGSGSETREP